MSARTLTVVTYHYVRDLERSRYPEIRGLDIQSFRNQISYFKNNYTFISLPDLIQAIEQTEKLPEKSILLTFNDNYIDHFRCVFPVLDEHDISGCFFPEIRAAEESIVLPNHKIHYILASVQNPNAIVHKIRELLNDYRNEYNLESEGMYFNRLAKPSEYDPKEVIYIKRLLQTELDENVSGIFIEHLFNEFVDVDEMVLSKELYMDKKHFECMMRHGMYFGIIGYNHRRLPSLSIEDQKDEIDRSKQYLINLGVNDDLLTVSYPWGDFNADTIKVLKACNIKAAFTSRPETADLDKHHRFEIPRFDTNHFK